MNILITGGRGYLAKALYGALSPHHEVTAITRLDFDLVDTLKTHEWFADKYFDVVIHTAIVGGSRLRPEDSWVLDTNLKMYYNLLDNHEHFERFINIGSGAEMYSTHTPYGMSKRIIRESLIDKANFCNIRVFAVFDENELDTRFIKSNLIRYINREPMLIHQDKAMDFFYMKDFLKLVEHYINNGGLPKEIDCSYREQSYLSDIAMRINDLSDYTVPIMCLNSGADPQYTGQFTDIGLSFDGLDVGIQRVYEALCNQ